MGTKMGRGGFDVKDLHSRKDLLKLPVGKEVTFHMMCWVDSQDFMVSN